MTPALELAARFWAKVDRSSVDGCWLWHGASRGVGYGAIKINGKVRDAHRVAYELTRGEIPAGLFVCHRCDVRRCVNPAHLFLGTVHENNGDMAAKGRRVSPEVQRQRALERRERGAVWGQKLTPEAAERIRELAAAGVSRQEIAASFGVTRSHVTRILRGRRWGCARVAFEQLASGAAS